MTELPNKLSQDYLESLIKTQEYKLISDRSVLCMITMTSGFQIHGISSVMDANNFDFGTGCAIAYENAFNKLWELESYHIFRMKESSNGCCCQ